MDIIISIAFAVFGAALIVALLRRSRISHQGALEVLKDDLEKLEEGQCYVHVADSPFWVKGAIQPFTGKSVAEAFIPRDPEKQKAHK